MKAVIKFLILSILITFSIASCRKTDPELTGIIEGVINNTQSLEPVKGAIVTINSSSKTTGDDGKFRFEDLEPKEYTVQVKADGYETNSKTIIAVAGQIVTADLALTPLVPILYVSSTILNFGMSETILPITISNIGKSRLEWSITENITWLSSNPVSGSTTSESSSLNITIERAGLSPKFYTQSFIVNSNGGNAIVTVNMIVQGPIPTAILSVTPQSGTTSQVFQIDASASTDDVDPTSSLMARWKWEDALQFSDWSTIKTASQQYATEGTKNITLEIRDSHGNVGTAFRSVIVNDLLTLPTLATNAVTNINTTTANCGGNIYTDGGSNINSRGLCWSLYQYPTIADNVTLDGNGLGSFTGILSGLTPGSTYYVRAYASNDVGVNYGNQVFFKAGENATQPSVTTSSLIVNSTTSITCIGNVVSAGTEPVSVRGFCWNTSPQPTILDSKTINGSGLGTFQTTINNLTPDNLYFIRAYATNIIGTSYGEELNFSTSLTVPVISTKNITDISAMGCMTGGSIQNTGGGSLSSRGVCYSTLEYPTINDEIISVSSGQTSFSASITNAIPNTIYYVRAYATNEAGTGYGDQKSFTTLDAEYYNFESGQMPVGFVGQWYMASSGYNSNYSIRSLYALSCSFTSSTSLANPGQIRFVYKHSDYGCGATYYYPTIKFYIDDVEQNVYTGDANQTWKDAAISVPAGTHILKWLFTPGHTQGDPWCGNGTDMGTGFIDNIYIMTNSGKLK